jgi:hypothetical protein
VSGRGRGLALLFATSIGITLTACSSSSSTGAGTSSAAPSNAAASTATASAGGATVGNKRIGDAASGISIEVPTSWTDANMAEMSPEAAAGKVCFVTLTVSKSESAGTYLATAASTAQFYK